MREKDDWAFPNDYHQNGMTLRDYFAAKFAAAMVGSIDSQAGYLRLKTLATSHSMTVSEWIAEKSYHQADEMLKVRAK